MVEGKVTADMSMSLDGYIAELGLLDELQLHIIPVMFGEGVRLFEHTGSVELASTSVVGSSGVVHSRYRFVK